MAVRYNQFAFFPSPRSGIPRDDTTVRTVNFTAVAGTRYFIDSVAYVTVTMPIGPADGDIVAVCGVGLGTGSTTVFGNGPSLQMLAGTQSFTFTFATGNLDLAFRYSTASGDWESIDTSVSSLLYGYPFTYAVPVSDSSGYPARARLNTSAFSTLGRVEGSNLQELPPWMQAHNLYGDGGGALFNTDVGVQTWWQSGIFTSWSRAHGVRWQGASDLILRGVYVSPTSQDQRHDKLVYNDTGLNGSGTYKNIIWKNEDTGAAATNSRIRHEGAAPSTDFSDYVQTPGTVVLLRYYSSISRWLVTPAVPSGRVDRGVTTTDAVATIIHTHQTNLANRVIAYKVQVEALETVGTPGRAALYDIAALFHRDGAGTVVQKGATAFLATIEDNAAWDVTFTISGTTIQMKVTGDGTDTVQWRVVGNITEHG